MGSNDKASPELRPYQFSITLDCNAKGFIQPSVKVLCDSLTLNVGEKGLMTLEACTVLMLNRIVKELKFSKYKVATDIEDIPKDDK